MKFKKGQIVYSQGAWKCKVVEDYGKSIRYIPLEGYATGEKGKEFTAAKYLFTKEYGKSTIIKNPTKMWSP